MRKTNLILVLLIVLAAFVCTTGVASAFEAIYVGNTVVDLQWPKYEGEDFSGYKLYRNETLIAALCRNAILYRDRASKGHAIRIHALSPQQNRCSYT